MPIECKDFFAQNDDDGRRLDKILKRILPQKPLSAIFMALRKGLIKLNGKKSNPEERVHKGDIISVAIFLVDELKENSPKSKNAFLSFSLETIFSNEHIFFINKPYNVSVHGKNSLVQMICSKNENESLSFKSGALHRLDKKTTGLLAFSVSLEGAKWFSFAIKEKIIQKYYVGIAEGYLAQKQEWKDYIEKSTTRKTKNFYTMSVSKSAQNSEHSIATTIATPLCYGKYNGKDVTLVQYQILTGKKHQIRAQSAFHNHALLGDSAYNAQKINEMQDFYLHAYQMLFPKNNPLGLPEVLIAPLNKNFTYMLKKILINWDFRLIIQS